MALIRVSMAVLATLLFAQAASAGFDKMASYSGPNGSYAAGTPMTCSGHAYCFPPQMEKLGKDPVCAKGYMYDEKAGKCTKVLAAVCPEDCHSKTVAGNLTCTKCPLGYSWGTDGTCEKACKSGYSRVMINGGKYCVADCKQGWSAAGDSCVADEAKFGTYTPKECAEKKCILNYELYFLNEANKTYSAYTMSNVNSYTKTTKKAPGCVCMKTMKRDLYPQDCQDPVKVAPKQTIDAVEPSCLDGGKAFLGKKCKGVCPMNWSEILFDKCRRSCPTGFKECKTPLGEVYCATKSALFGWDSCDMLNKLFLHMDKDATCQYPVVKPAPKPSSPKSG